MKAIIIVAALVTVSAAASADQVRGYFRQNGTYVQPYFRSAPNSTRFDNYSRRGNINPYTGSRGYASPYGRWELGGKTQRYQNYMLND